MLVRRTISRSHFHILGKLDEKSEVAAHDSAVYAASVGENYVLAEPPIQESVRLTDVVGHRLDEEGRSHD